MKIYVASSNAGKLREFTAAAAAVKVGIAPIPSLKEIAAPAETGATFEENARFKAIAYSRHVPGELVIADDSGLEVAALGGAPGVHSARYAAEGKHRAIDRDNNYKLLAELRRLGDVDRSAQFVCVIAAARDGQVLRTFQGQAQGEILQGQLGHRGFGYDPLFFVPAANKTFAEMSDDEKLRYSHRGAAFRGFLEWLLQEPGFTT